MSHKPISGKDTVFAALYVFTAELWGVEYAASALYRYHYDTASLTLVRTITTWETVG